VVQSRSAPVAAPVPAPAAVLPAVAPPALPVTPVVPAAPVVAPAGSTAAGAPAAPAAPAAHGVLHLEFATEAWAEIKDASGQVLLNKLNPAGSSMDIQGQPPFDMVIGNAAQAKMTYNGRPIDLKPYIDATVARFTLE